MRFLGIDYGRKRIGLALSDEEGILASPLPVYLRVDEKRDIVHLAALAQDRRVGGIVIGLPRHMDGSAGEMAREVETFADALRSAAGLATELFDERLTSREAERVLIEADVSRGRRKALRDGLSAVLILQGYLDRRRSRL